MNSTARKFELRSWREWLRASAQRARSLMRARNWRHSVSPILLILGALLVGYVGVQYGEMFYEQRELAHEWERQQHARTTPSPAGVAKSEGNGLTRISVPKIDLESVIVEGTTHKALLLGPGHLKDTPAPGELGNSVISGHRDTFFRHIRELEKGDTLTVQREGKTFTYEVTGKKIVEPDDLSVIRPVKDRQLTLITCYPTYYIGPAPKRLVVFSKMIGEKDQSAQASAGSH